MPEETDKLQQLDVVVPPSIDDALRALEFWRNLDRLYEPVRTLENPQGQVTFSINSSPMLNCTSER